MGTLATFAEAPQFTRTSCSVLTVKKTEVNTCFQAIPGAPRGLRSYSKYQPNCSSEVFCKGIVSTAVFCSQTSEDQELAESA